ncbi:MAG: precorrin-3B C(17)-methyltransferase [Pseudobutyrivibrio sp.]|nr:precorrin-3B C(17)-methyltransferase [Pseudobutyrivibrio sp.]
MISRKIIRCVYFTDKGQELAERIFEECQEWIPEYRRDEDLREWTKESFLLHLPILFIGACGICVRTISPFIEDKLRDSPVLVVDELGLNVISLLSGHMGGANALAKELAHAIGANPVITTASDVNNAFAIDEYARVNGYRISDRKAIKEINGQFIKSNKDFDPKEKFPGVLIKKRLVLGMGCKKGKSFEELKKFINEYYEDEYLRDNLYSIASIDVKAEETGLIKLAMFYGAKIFFYSAEELRAVEGDFTESDFVEKTVGVGNVCERSALLAAGLKGSLMAEKRAKDGITLAEAQRSEENIKSTNREYGHIYVVGLGPGKKDYMTVEAIKAIQNSDIIVGYTVYVDLVRDFSYGKEIFATGMRQEIDRCKACFEFAMEGKNVALVCSGDSGVYGMAAPMYELLPAYPGVEISVVAGVTAALSGAAALGCPINHDFCLISLSDLMTPWSAIERRIRAAIDGDFAMALYNPSSHKRADYLKKAVEIMLDQGASPDRACGYVENIGRKGTKTYTCSLAQLKETQVNMFTTVFVGNSNSYIDEGKLITKRGYKIYE